MHGFGNITPVPAAKIGGTNGTTCAMTAVPGATPRSNPASMTATKALKSALSTIAWPRVGLAGALLSRPSGSARTLHNRADMIRARMHAIACGYKDADVQEPGGRGAPIKLPQSREA
jgi:hypothetical protein